MLLSKKKMPYHNYSEGLVAFDNGIYSNQRITHVYGYMDKKGKIVIKAQFASADEFKNGLAKVRDKKTGFHLYIDKMGNYIYYPKIQ